MTKELDDYATEIAVILEKVSKTLGNRDFADQLTGKERTAYLLATERFIRARDYLRQAVKALDDLESSN